MEDSRNTEIYIFECRAAEGVELLAGNNREVHLWVIENRGVGTAAGKSDDTAEFETFQRVELRRPHPGRHKAVRLIQQRRPTLRGLVELIEVSGPLVGGLRQRVGDRAQ